MNRTRLLTPLIALLAVVVFPITAEAGSVFLKNGYIIQGNVVERNDEQIVLGWPNGQMTIHRRFIEELILEPREEEELARGGPADKLDTPTEAPVVEQRVLVELPSKIEDILPMDASGPNRPISSNPPQGNPDASPTISHPGVTVTVPLVEGVPEVEFTDAGIALGPPAGWEVHEEAGLIRFRKSSSEPFPCFIVSFEKGMTLDNQEARQLLMTALEEEVGGVTVLAERELQVGFERAFVLDGELSDEKLSFSQVFLQHDETCYLIGLQLPSPVDPREQRTLERCLHSIRFLDR